MHRLISRLGFSSYEELHSWSVEQPEGFWSTMWDELAVIGDRGEPVVVEGETMRSARFFPQARLNVAENILRGGPGPDDDEAFILSLDERGGPALTLTRGQARAQVARISAALRADGVGVGDVVAAWMPNVAETVLVMLAAASIGATFTSTSSDFGVDGVLDRFTQVNPTVLVSADGYRYNGKELDCLQRLGEIVAGLPSLRRTVVVSVLGVGEANKPGTGLTRYEDWLEPHEDAQLRFEALGFDHPWYVLYSSGTTGVPKCIVHRAGGVLLQHLKEHRFHAGIEAGDRVFYFTTCGWMMWNWLVSAPALGAAIVLYDGSPFHPGPQRLWELAQREGFTFFGTSAKYLDSIRKADFDPRQVGDLADLRAMASTGSPLSPETNAWAVAHLPPAVHLGSISGGTDLCATFVAGDPSAPVYAGVIQRPTLAMAVAVLDPDGHEVAAGERGELCCTAPFPSMPLGFANDPDGERYRRAYFERDPHVWHHGDFASWTAQGGVIIHGRSDTTLNPGGVRIGTAEIYRRVEEIPEVVESLVFGQDHEDDSRIVLLVRLAAGAAFGEELVARIRHVIRIGCTPRHVPAVVIAVDDLPRTRSGKLAELAVSDAVNGREVRNTSALANPEAIWAIARRPELAS